MKKLFLLMAALLLLIPPLHAEELQYFEFYSAINKANNYNSNPLYYTQTTNKSSTTTTISGYTKFTSSQPTGSSTTYLVNLRRYSPDQTDAITITTTTATGKPSSSGMSYGTNTTISWSKKLTIEAAFGTIKNIRLTLSSQATSQSNITMNPVSSSGSSNYKYKENKNGYWEYEVLDPTKSVVLVPTSGTKYIRKIEITWTPGDPVPPEQPTLTVSDTYHYEYDAQTNVMRIPCLPNTSCVSANMPRYGTSLYYTFNKDLPVPASATDANIGTAETANKTKWVPYPTSGIPFKNVVPTNKDDLTATENEFDLRVIAYGALSKEFSEEVITHCRYIYLSAPSVDKEKTESVDGQKYDAATNTVTYTRGNPVVYIKATKTGSPLYSYYTDDFSDPTDSENTKLKSISSSDPIAVSFNNWGGEGYPYPPVNTFNEIKIISYSKGGLISGTTFYDEYYNANNKPFTVRVVRVAPDTPEAPTLVQATVDEENFTGNKIPKRIGFDNKAEFTFSIPGQIDKKLYKVFETRPESSVDASTWTEFTEDKLTVSKEQLPAGATDAWIGVAYTTSAGTSDPLWIHVGLKAPAAPEIKWNGGSYDNGSERVVFGASLDANFTVSEDANVIEYCMERGSNSDGSEPSSNTERLKLTVNGTNPLKIIAERIETGRLFYRAGHSVGDATVWSEWAYTDFKRETITPVSLNGKYTTWPNAVADGTLVHLNENLRIMGFYTTNAILGVNNSSPGYLYVINQDGEAIKLVGSNQALKSWPDYIKNITNEQYENNNYVLKGVYGWVKYVNNENNMPEIYLTQGSSYDSETLYDMLPKPEISADWALTAKGQAAQNPDNRTSIDRRDDFGRYVTVRSLKWLDDKNEFEMADGTRIPVYDRFKEYPLQYYTANLVKDRLYCVRGFVGLAAGTISIFPNAEILQCPGTPNLFAPNPIKGDTGSDGFIDIRAVSDKVTFTVKGNADGESEFTYTVNGGDEQNVDKDTKQFTIDLSGRTDGEKIKLVVYAHLNGMKSLAPAKVRITKRTATQVESISKYKETELANPSDNVYQITGKVIIEAMTDKYLYVRDYTDAPEAEMDDDEHLRRLLIKNDNGWTTDFEKEGRAEPLTVGDVIYGFAISPTHDRGNLLGDNTGFARTIKYDRHETTGAGNYESVDAGPTDNFKFSGKYRMCMVKLKGVQLKERQANTDPYTKDEYPWLYTLDLPTPTRMRMDVFVRTGFAEAYASGVGFELTGIAMIDNEDDNDTEDKGKYAFALMSFEGSAKLAAPKVFIDGQDAVDGDYAEIEYTGTGTIKMTAEAEDYKGNPLTLTGDQKVTVYYSIDGLDPLKVITSRKEYGKADASELELGEGDIEIKAFAAVRGMTPSDVVTRRFRKNSHDVQFILNFLQSAKEGEAYRFTGDTKVVAMGGDYMFVVGRVGHYLPIKLEGGWAGKGISENDLLSGFTVRFHEDENGNRIAVADEFAGTFTSEGAADDKFTHEPDVTDALDIEKHPRRLVTLKGVTASATDDASGRDIDNWSISESGDHGTHALRAGILGNVDVYTVDEDGNKQPVAEGFADGATYDITGFVMLNDPAKEGKMEMWPLEAKLLRKTAAVTAKIGDGNTQSTNAAGEITASFEGMTMVSLSCPSKDSRIYYAFDRSKGFSSDNLTWYEYQHEFAVTKDTYIHAKAVAPNAVESDHTHIALTALGKSGDVEFNVNAGDGITTLTIAPAAGAAAGSTIWYSEGNDRSCNKVYTAGTELKYTEETTVYACIQEPGKAKGAVSSIRVMVVDMPQGGGNDNAKVSGKVVFTIDDTTDPSKVTVYLAPEEGLAGTIYYLINPTEQVTPENGTKYENPIEMKEGGRIMAILVEAGKLAGEPTDIAVWLIPTDIDGIDSEEREDAIRAEGGRIIAPEGSEVYDITGRRVNATGLRAGIYIVRTPGGKAVKVKVD